MRLLFRLSTSLTQAIVGSALFFGLFSCEGEKGGIKETEQPTGVQPPKAAEVNAVPLKVSVFLEYSGGMKGFVPKSGTATPTEFQQRVGNVLTETYTNPAFGEKRFFLCLKDSVRESIKFENILEVVQGQLDKAALGTELPELLSSIVKRPEANREVSVVISDFVYGAQNKQAPSQLMNRIRVALAPVRQQGLAVAVLGEVSRFEGIFHPAVIRPVESRILKNGHLPYYIWVIGQPKDVARYLSEVKRATGKVEQAYFGLTFPKTPSMAVLDGLPANSGMEPSGDASVSFADANPSHNLDIEDVDKVAEFTVALNLSQLPAAWQEPAFLSHQLQVMLPGTTPQIVKNSVRLITNAQRNASATLKPYSHILRVHLTALPAGNSKLTISLPAPEVPTWVSQWSTEDDNLPGAMPHTYRLTQIMAGLRASFPQSLPAVFTADFTINNQQ